MNSIFRTQHDWRRTPWRQLRPIHWWLLKVFTGYTVRQVTWRGKTYAITETFMVHGDTLVLNIKNERLVLRRHWRTFVPHEADQQRIES